MPSKIESRIRILLLLSVTVSLLSCNDQNRIKSELNSLMSKSIELPKGMQAVFLGKDTIIDDFVNSKIKMVVYADSLGCTSCGINNIYLWEPFVEYARAYHGGLRFYFIYAPAKMDLKYISNNIGNSLFEYPIFLDSKYEFERLNPHLPKNKAMHTFLLDEDNNVILVGNPLYNKEIEKMFYEEVEKRLL